MVAFTSVNVTVVCTLAIAWAGSIAAESYTAGANADKVTYLPGAQSPLVSNQFSGYLDISDTRALHYMYFESERDPVTDSVIFWTNGGPGCSGLLGLYTEFGPWRSGPNLTLIRNPFTWVKYANIVFLEQPVGVGFSYSTKNISHTGYNDFEASRDNLLAIKAFFRKYPERAQNAFYLASESYGGHYIPQWTLQVLNDKTVRKNFKGYLLGNPYTSYGAGSTAMANTLWGLQLVPKPLWDAFTELECESLFSSAYDFMQHTPDCFEILDALESYVELLNPYALEFPTCVVADANSTDTTTTHNANTKHRIFDIASVTSTTTSTATATDSSATGTPASLVSAQANMLLRLSKKVRKQHASSTDTTSTVNTARSAGSKIVLESDISGAHELNTVRNKGHYSQYRYQYNAANRPDTTPGAHTSRASHNMHHTNAHKYAVLSEESEFRYDPCAQNYLVEYLNNAAVQEALHVSSTPTPTPIVSTTTFTTSSTTSTTSTTASTATDSTTSTTRRWDFCSDEVNEHWAFNDYLADTTSLYRLIYTHKHKPKGFKMLVYSGDIDGVCGTVGTQHWIYNVTHSAPTTLYQTWTYTDTAYGEQLGGYMTQFADSFTFFTIRYAGHEVPAYQPQKALHMFNMYLDGTMFVK